MNAAQREHTPVPKHSPREGFYSLLETAGGGHLCSGAVWLYSTRLWVRPDQRSGIGSPCWQQGVGTHTNFLGVDVLSSAAPGAVPRRFCLLISSGVGATHWVGQFVKVCLRVDTDRNPNRGSAEGEQVLERPRRLLLPSFLPRTEFTGLKATNSENGAAFIPFRLAAVGECSRFAACFVRKDAASKPARRLPGGHLSMEPQ